MAVPLLALQREGALGARLEGHRPRTPLAPARLPRAARPLDDGAEGAAGPNRRRRDDPRLDAHHRAPRAPATRAGALSGRRRRAPPGARARGLLAPRVPLCATGAAARAGRALARGLRRSPSVPLGGRDVPAPPRHVGGDRRVTGPPVLWHFPISHYNEKARWALDWKGIPHVRRALAMSYVPRALWATGQAKLPILFLDGQAIADSTRIIEALERLQPEPALYPRDEAARRRALALEDFFDEEVGHAVRTAIVGPLFAHDPVSAGSVLTTGMGAGARRAVRAVLPAFRAFYKLRHGIDDAAIAVAPARVRAGLDRIAAELGPSGHLVGDAFSVADLTAAALFSPIVLPPEFPYPPPEPRPRHVLALRASLEGHPAFRWVLETYRRYRGTSAAIAG